MQTLNERVDSAEAKLDKVGGLIVSVMRQLRWLARCERSCRLCVQRQSRARQVLMNSLVLWRGR